MRSRTYKDTVLKPVTRDNIKQADMRQIDLIQGGSIVTPEKSCKRRRLATGFLIFGRTCSHSRDLLGIMHAHSEDIAALVRLR